ncbi:hypothetical protein [Methanococcus voltae]|uniref:PepSY domain-containing protein n=1 Tax=Methanococcus voltae PS TaxID=523842 RepID=A0ABT2EWN7_METVO|nr:hypothetical protein [Methanococcus voltae]MBP2173064.1 hypothetical protein [Methanococcus voltae]MCS3922044.1 hypothetical protein [Methanococcus voltae PS]
MDENGMYYKIIYAIIIIIIGGAFGAAIIKVGGCLLEMSTEMSNPEVRENISKNLEAQQLEYEKQYDFEDYYEKSQYRTRDGCQYYVLHYKPTNQSYVVINGMRSLAMAEINN